MSRGRWALATLVVALGAAAVWYALRTADGGSTTIGTSAAVDGIEVAFAGCAAVRRGPVCELASARTVTLWTRAEGSLTITADEVSLRARTKPTDGGRRVRVDVPSGSQRLTVATAAASWSIAVAEHARPEAITAARERMSHQDLDGAAAALEGDVPEAVAGRALGLLARVRLRQGRPEDAVALLGRSTAHHAEAGLLSELARDSFALAHTLAGSWRFSEARGALDRLDAALGADHPEGRATAPFYRAMVAADTGDVRQALALLVDTETRSGRLGLDRQSADAVQLRALTLDRLGRSAEAVALLEPLVDPDDHPCARAIVLTNLGWVRLRAGLAASGTDEGRTRARDELVQAAGLLKDGCPRPRELANAQVNVALAELARGDHAAAAAALAASREVGEQAPAFVQAWWRQLDGALALARRDGAAALGHYDDLSARAAAGAAPALSWRAEVGRGRALELLARDDDAAEAYRRAEGHLRDQSLRAPLGEGRDVFLSGHDESARLLVDMLVRTGQVDDAFAVARRARGRLLAWLRRVDRLQHLPPGARVKWEAALSAWKRERQALEEDAAGDWQRSVEELTARRAERAKQLEQAQAHLEAAFAVLAEGAAPAWEPPAPAPGELVLAWFPGRQGWIAFAATAEGVRAARVAALPTEPEALAAALLGPFAEAIDGARRLRLLPYGRLRHVDLHALPFRGRPLVARAPVTYGLDLPPSGAPTDAPGVVVIADPSGDLPATLEEAAVVRAALAAAGPVTSLEATDATGAAVREALTTAGRLHFAGHADHAGRDGSESALRLADGGRFTVGDILALERAPSRVYLSGCETGAAGEDAAVEGLGLAQAFVAVGADDVLATARPVPDALSKRIATLVYGAAEAPDQATALRRAQLAVAEETPDADWAAYRVYVR